ncbi:hypothetical protein HY384_00920 [Candidatus Daviesbacteria bacterium]|nr:hypothetical protein [Candidatus Daviesbacteria bacterium]
MISLSKITSFISFGKKPKVLEYYFALNIGVEKLTSGLWTIENNQLEILQTAAQNYGSTEEIFKVTDKLLDQVLGLREIEPQKILFGVPDSWILDDNLKDENLKILRKLVKELELTPMAYVADSQAIVHFLEKMEGVPPTAILVGFDKHHLIVSVVRAGKLDGVRVVTRGENSSSDIEKALLTFTDIETLPSKILIHGESAAGLRNQLLSFSWMVKLSFLHFPKIDVLAEDLEIKSVCLAGASEINENIKFTDTAIEKSTPSQPLESTESNSSDTSKIDESNFGFVTGDISDQIKKEEVLIPEVEAEAEELTLSEESNLEESNILETTDFESHTVERPLVKEQLKERFTRNLNLAVIKKYLPKWSVKLPIILGGFGLILALLAGYILIPKAEVKIFVEPRILEKDAQVTADPNQKTVLEDTKVIPGQIVETEVAGNLKDTATGKKQVGESAKGTVVVYNKTFEAKSLSKGTVLTSNNGLKFALDTTVNIASQSATDSGITFGKANITVTASAIGADSNLASSSELTINGFSSSQLLAKAEGNFSGGTSKEVTVVSSEDAQRLLAKLSSDLRLQAQQKLQGQLADKKILAEALSENIIKKSYNKNINDQANEFSLNLTIRYKGTAFEEKDLHLIVSKLVTTQVPEGFQFDLSQTETQADVSKLDHDGKLIFLARFKAKLIPKIDTEKILNQIRFKTPEEVLSLVKNMDNVLGADIKMIPDLPKFFARMPILSKNIKIEVGLK